MKCNHVATVPVDRAEGNPSASCSREHPTKATPVPAAPKSILPAYQVAGQKL